MKRLILIYTATIAFGLIHAQPIELKKCDYLKGTRLMYPINHIQNIGDSILYFECPPESSLNSHGKTGNSWGLIRPHSFVDPYFIKYVYEPYWPFNNIFIKDTMFLVHTEPIYFNWSKKVSQNHLNFQKFIIDSTVYPLHTYYIDNFVNYKTPVGLYNYSDHIYAITYDGKIINLYNSTEDMLFRDYQRKYNLDTVIDDMYVSKSIEFGYLPTKKVIQFVYQFYSIVIDNHGNVYKHIDSKSDTLVFKKLDYNLGEWKAGEVSGLNKNYLVYDGKKGIVIIDSTGRIILKNSISKGFPVIEGSKIHYITFGSRKPIKAVTNVIKNKALISYQIKYGFIIKDEVLLLSKDGFIYTCHKEGLLNPQ